MKTVCYLCGKLMDIDKDDIRTDDETGEDICEECDENYPFDDDEDYYPDDRRDDPVYYHEEYPFDENSDYLFP